jgi:glycosyltransferase involved in cell wall biosynthesis
MSSILFVANAWGPKAGGVNAFNFDLATACGEICAEKKFPVGCLVPDASESEIEHARVSGVELISLKKRTGIDSFDGEALPHIVAFAKAELKQWRHVVGHDILTGPTALDLADTLNSKKVLFVHTHYGAYKAVQDEGRGQRQTEKEITQANCVRRAHKVFGVGPLLADAARDLHGGNKREKRRIANFTPGMHQLTPRLIERNFFGITAGRFDLRNDIIKQPSLAVAAYGAYARDSAQDHTHNDIHLRMAVVGLSELENEFHLQRLKLEEILFEASERRINLSCHKFADRERLWDEFGPAAVGMMLSWHEGFGLIGLEMIAAGLPLILTRNSGLYRLLEKEFPHLRGCYYPVTVSGPKVGELYNPSDIHDVKVELEKIARDMKSAQRGAMALRKVFLKKHPWRKRANTFLKQLDSKEFLFGPIPKVQKRRKKRK